MRSALHIARFTLLEAWRTRAPWIVAAMALVGVLVSLFGAGLAITESETTRAALLGSFLRWGAVLFMALFVITSSVREFDDKVHELVLSTAVPRHAWFAGKLLGYGATGSLVALAFTVPVLWAAPAADALVWGLSLGCELAIVAAASLFALYTFGQVLPAFAAVFGFYLLARAMAAIQLMNHSVYAGGEGWSQQVMSGVLDVIAFLLPSLDRFTQSDWLAHGTPAAALGLVLGQTAIYLLFLAGGALFDLYRKNF